MRLLFLCLLIAAESFYLSMRFDAWDLFDAGAGTGYQWIAAAGHVAKIAIAFGVAFAIATFPRLKAHAATYLSATSTYRWQIPAVIQIAAYSALLLCTISVFATASGEAAQIPWLPVAWGSLLVLVVVTWLLSLAPVSWWSDLWRREKGPAILAALVAVMAWAIAYSSQELWDPLSRITFETSAWLLGWFYADVIVIPPELILGTGDFVVRINAACSGYEGIGLVTAFLAFYLSIYRDEFRFPHALLLFPIGIASIWGFNSIRIVALIAIGAEWSRDIALGGFHSQAGWIAFTIVAAALLVGAHRVKSFRATQVRDVGAKPQMNVQVAMLVPLGVLLATTLLTQSLSGGFDWLYPLRVIAVGLAIAILWPQIRPTTSLRFGLPVVAGIAVFAMWIATVPRDGSVDAQFAQALDGTEPWTAVAWLLIRLVGAVVTVPIAEELAFRGYLLSRLSNNTNYIAGEVPVSWLAIIVSSVVFGLLHTAILPGMLAGLAYAIVRLKSDSVWAAVIAHATTNLLLGVYVLSSQSWSLW